MKLVVVSALLASALLVTTSAQAEASRPYLTAEKAQAGIQACMTLAKEKGWNMSMVIVDRGMDVRASMRMDEALPASYTGATLKAETSLSWGMPTGKVYEITQKQPVFNQFPGLLPIGGGEPVFSKDKKLIAAIGIAGGYIQHDEACAKAAVAAMSK
ncbi:GlcG/HbpS family heme-binding protein [Pelagibaculum spongiae]|uniref:Heme-binding protein n=1 Tax=Pelagibaculum spongiae TaxID=2080658 RepID=A0A2V1GSI9_9GAMM|nr:heme-binding protein [Pelagibaculum spongiae]PVZ68359.1 heme-binding protein [Pelagibaculum spongiae]